MKLDESLAKLRREKDAAIDKLQLELSNLRSALAKPASSVLGASAMGDSVMSADINQSVQARDSVSESLRDALDNEKVSVKRWASTQESMPLFWETLGLIPWTIIV